VCVCALWYRTCGRASHNSTNGFGACVHVCVGVCEGVRCAYRCWGRGRARRGMGPPLLYYRSCYVSPKQGRDTHSRGTCVWVPKPL
jgi:hypothetical protein